MKDVDFGYIRTSGSTIFRICFQKYAEAQQTELSSDGSDYLVSLVVKTERIFFFLVEKGSNKLISVMSRVGTNLPPFFYHRNLSVFGKTHDWSINSVTNKWSDFG